MKRISVFLLAAIMLLSLVGCGSTDIDPQLWFREPDLCIELNDRRSTGASKR